jgi:PAS domain S-box-containing protein
MAPPPNSKGNPVSKAGKHDRVDLAALVDVPIAIADSDFHLLSWNESFVALVGTVPVSGADNIVDYFEWEIEKSEIAKEVENVGYWSGRAQVARENEHPIPVSVSINKNGGNGSFVFVVQDLSAMAAVERMVRETEETFRAFTENSDDCIMRFDRNHRHLYASPIVEAQTGIPPEDFIGKSHEELGFPPDLIEIWEEAIDKTFQTNRPQRIEFQLPTGVWIDWLLVPERDVDGEAFAVIGSAREITELKNTERELLEARETLEARVEERTKHLEKVNKRLIEEIAERKRAEEQARKSQETYRFLYEESATVNVIVGMDGTIRDINNRFAEQLGFKKEDMVGRAVDHFVSAKHRESVTAQLEQDYLGDDTPAMEVDLYAKGGQIHTILFSPGQVVIRDGSEPTGVLVTGVDITERKNLERELTRYAREIGLYNDILTHDINNINQAILTYLNLITAGEVGEFNSDQGRFLGVCKDQIHRCTALIDKIRTLTQLQHEQPEALHPVELSPLLYGTIKTVESAYAAIGAKFEFTPGKGEKVLADRLVHQLFYNLLENAVKHAQRTEGITVWVEVADDHHEGVPAWKVNIADNGPGIRDEIKAEIFNRFDGNGERKGSGLGLAIVKALAQKYNGTVTVQDRKTSGPDKGSCFSVLLPKA